MLLSRIASVSQMFRKTSYAFTVAGEPNFLEMVS